jgi:hypothetical protein
MLIGNYKNRIFYYNTYWMEIYEYHPRNNKMIKKRNFHKWERLIKWEKENSLINHTLK